MRNSRNSELICNYGTLLVVVVFFDVFCRTQDDDGDDDYDMI